jgi:UDP-3-O-[3-hydroxymyristoyl] N-acetylglucosamine deacetylase
MTRVILQRTLKNSIKATGVTVHSGERSQLTLRPAPVNTGIVFRAVNQNNTLIPALNKYVTDTTLSTTISKDGASISTVEHLLSAFSGLGIDNAYVDVTTREIPIMDGSAGPFVFLMQSAGIESQAAPKKFIRIKKTIEVKSEGKVARLSPYAGFKAAFDIEYDHPAIHEEIQFVELDLSTSSFVKEVSRARTYGFMADYEKIRAMDLAKGASMDNAIVMDDFKVLNDDGLRYPDELVKHKVLDAIGDLYLLGANLIGAFYGFKSGHALNNELAAAVLANQEAWEYATFEDGASSPVSFSDPAFAH